jgi:LacI family transcriptional regulator
VPRATLKAVAEKAQVSEMTVSAILNGRYTPRRKDAVRRAKRIRRIADELGYRPNAAARTMASGRFGAVALLLSADGSGRSNLPEGLLRGLTTALEERGLHLVITDLPDDRLTDETYVPKILREWMSDGLLINYNWQIPRRMSQLIEDYEIPSIWVNCKRDRDCVYPDDFDAGRRLAKLFLGHGHRRVAYADFHYGFEAGTEQEHYSKPDRWAGYVAAMREAGLPARRLDTGDSPHRNRSTYEFWANAETTPLARADRPTAVIEYGGSAGAVALAARALGLRIPEDLALATFAEGDRAFVHGLQVPSMLLPHEQVGRKAVEMMLEKIERPAVPLEPVRVPFRLDARGAAAPSAEAR